MFSLNDGLGIRGLLEGSTAGAKSPVTGSVCRVLLIDSNDSYGRSSGTAQHSTTSQMGHLTVHLEQGVADVTKILPRKQRQPLLDPFKSVDRVSGRKSAQLTRGTPVMATPAPWAATVSRSCGLRTSAFCMDVAFSPLA